MKPYTVIYTKEVALGGVAVMAKRIWAEDDETPEQACAKLKISPIYIYVGHPELHDEVVYSAPPLQPPRIGAELPKP